MLLALVKDVASFELSLFLFDAADDDDDDDDEELRFLVAAAPPVFRCVLSTGLMRIISSISDTNECAIANASTRPIDVLFVCN